MIFMVIKFGVDVVRFNEFEKSMAYVEKARGLASLVAVLQVQPTPLSSFRNA